LSKEMSMVPLQGIIRNNKHDFMKLQVIQLCLAKEEETID